MTPLWRPSTKDEHDESLRRFIYDFNKSYSQNISIDMYKEEKFVHDGVINLLGTIVHYDWEKRHSWEGEKFPFETLGQLERKFVAEKGIDLTIQCNKEETHFVVAWHRNFEEVVEKLRKANHGLFESGKMRTTKKFAVFNYREMERFKKWLLRNYRSE